MVVIITCCAVSRARAPTGPPSVSPPVTESAHRAQCVSHRGGVRHDNAAGLLSFPDNHVFSGKLTGEKCVRTTGIFSAAA